MANLPKNKDHGKIWSLTTFRDPDSFDDRFIFMRNDEPYGDVTVEYGKWEDQAQTPEGSFTISHRDLNMLSMIFLDNNHRDKIDFLMRNIAPEKRGVQAMLWSTVEVTYNRTENSQEEGQAQYEDWYYRRHPEKKKED